MARIKFCNLCNRDIQPIKKFNWLIFLLLCVTGIGGIFYLVWSFIFKKPNRCPICNNSKLLKSDSTVTLVDKLKTAIKK